MKLVVLGRGLAAMGLLWNVAKSAKGPDEIYWIGHCAIDSADKDSHLCSYYSTALVARQGIEKGISPLGDLLYSSYFDTLSFVKEFSPPGVCSLRRFHLNYGDDALAKIEARFGSTESLDFNGVHLEEGHEEQALSFNPQIFLSWFEKEILGALSQRQIKTHLIEDLVTDVADDRIHTLQNGEFYFDKFANCSGAFACDFPLIKENLMKGHKIPKKAVGHYLYWDGVEFEDVNIGDESFALTWKGHNLIYRSNDESLVWGGSTYNDAINAPRIKDLEQGLNELLSHFPKFKFKGNKELRTGMRSKGVKRKPIIKLSDDGKHLSLNGYYKNGWSLCHRLGKEGASLLFPSDL